VYVVAVVAAGSKKGLHGVSKSAAVLLRKVVCAVVPRKEMTFVPPKERRLAAYGRRGGILFAFER
jgi:hypothetical protein